MPRQSARPAASGARELGAFRRLGGNPAPAGTGPGTGLSRASCRTEGCAAVGGGKALIPSNAKVAAAGTPIDLPLGHKDEAWSFDHFDTVTVMIADAPRPDEIVLCVAVSDGGRPHPRVGSGPITN